MKTKSGKDSEFYCVKCGSKHVEYELTITQYFISKKELMHECDHIETRKVFRVNCDSCQHSQDITNDALLLNNPFVR